MTDMVSCLLVRVICFKGKKKDRGKVISVVLVSAYNVRRIVIRAVCLHESRR